MRVLITGATGNVGTSLVSALGRDPAVDAVVGLARRRPEWQPSKTTWVEADVASDDLDPHFAGVDAVVHLAWKFQPTHDPIDTWRANAVGSRRVFDATARAGARALVYASSVGAYSPGPDDGRPVDETWPTDSRPTAAYGREKAYVERALDAFECRHPDVRTVRMRPGFIFKAVAASEQRRIFAGPLLPGSLVRPPLVPVVPAFPGLRFQVLHTDDAADAFRRALTTDVRGAFNVASDPVIDARELAQVMSARTVPVPARALRAVLSAAWHLRLVPASPELFDLATSLPLMDTTRARAELGWTARIAAPDAIRSFLEGVQDGAGAPTPPLAPDTPARRVEELSTRGWSRDSN